MSSRVKLIYLIVALIILGAGVLIFQHSLAYLSPTPKEIRNRSNSLKLNVGMDSSTVLEIMGDPDTIFRDTALSSHYCKGCVEFWYYTPPVGSSEGIDIYLDSLGKVGRIDLAK